MAENLYMCSEKSTCPKRLFKFILADSERDSKGPKSKNKLLVVLHTWFVYLVVKTFQFEPFIIIVKYNEILTSRKYIDVRPES